MGRSFDYIDNEIVEVTMYPQCNIYKGICNPIIPIGFYECFQCRGVGCFHFISHFKRGCVEIIVCPLCKGKGYIDWITNIRKIRKIFTRDDFRNTEYLSFKCKTLKSCKVIKRWAKENE